MPDVIKPVQAIVEPEPGSSVTTTTPQIVWTITDDGGSGVNLYSISCDLDGDVYDIVNGIDNYWSITGGYRLMVVPYGALAEGYHTFTLTGSDNDGNAAPVIYGTFKVDLTSPSVTVTSPVSGSSTTNSSVVVAGNVSEAVTIVINVGGSDVATLTSSGSFSTVVPIAMGSNTITVTVTDGAGYTGTDSVTVTRSNLTLIYDRVQADVDHYNELRAKLKAGTASASERTEYNGTPKGGYKAADLNRVGVALNTVASDLTAAGYPYDPQAKTNWANNSYFLASDMVTYLANVQGLRDILPVFPTTPAVPADVSTYQQANAIEKIIADVNTLYHNMVDEYSYLGDLYMGEV